MGEKAHNELGATIAISKGKFARNPIQGCLLYTSDAADERSSVDLGGRRIIKKKKQSQTEHDSGTIEKINSNEKQ